MTKAQSLKELSAIESLNKQITDFLVGISRSDGIVKDAFIKAFDLPGFNRRVNEALRSNPDDPNRPRLLTYKYCLAIGVEDKKEFYKIKSRYIASSLNMIEDENARIFAFSYMAHYNKDVAKNLLPEFIQNLKNIDSLGPRAVDILSERLKDFDVNSNAKASLEIFFKVISSNNKVAINALLPVFISKFGEDKSSLLKDQIGKDIRSLYTIRMMNALKGNWGESKKIKNQQQLMREAKTRMSEEIKKIHPARKR